MKKLLLLLLSLVLSTLVFGCVEQTGEPSQTPTATIQPTETPTIPVATPTVTPTATPQAVPTTIPPDQSWPPENRTTTIPVSPDVDLEPGREYEVTVMEVIEGDILRVLLPDGQMETVKMLGIEVPDTTPTNNIPHSCGKKLTNLGCLAEHGRDAKQFVNSILVGETCSIELDDTAGLIEEGMLLAYVDYEEDFNQRLLEEGYACVSDEEFSRKQEYLQAQRTPSRNSIGLWECRHDEEVTSLSLGFYRIHSDAMGDDYSNLNNEYIILMNYHNRSVSLANWTLRNEDNESFDLPDVSIAGGSTITLYSGSGVSTANNYYLGSDSPIWDNENSAAYLYNPDKELADYCRW